MRIRICRNAYLTVTVHVASAVLIWGGRRLPRPSLCVKDYSIGSSYNTAVTLTDLSVLCEETRPNGTSSTLI